MKKISLLSLAFLSTASIYAMDQIMMGPTNPIHQNLELQDPYEINLSTFNEEINPDVFLGVNNLVLKGNLEPDHDFSMLDGITKLTLEDGYITDISLLGNLPQSIQELHIKNFNFKNKNKEPAFLKFSIFKKLKKLDWHNEQWSGHGICKISKEFLPANLESLKLSGVRLALDPKFSGNQLKELELICPSSQISGNDQRSANREWVALKNDCFAPEVFQNLEKLIIKDVDIQELDSIKFRNLKTFSFEISKKHEKFPQSIGKLPITVSNLSLSRPELGKTFPFSWDFLSELPNLQRLSLENFVLEGISKMAGNSLNLEHLEIKPGSQEIPDLSHLKGLKTLGLIIPKMMELDKKQLPKSLKTLNLTSCCEKDTDGLYHKFTREWNGIQIKGSRFKGILQFNNPSNSKEEILGIYTDRKKFKHQQGSILAPFCDLDDLNLSKAQELDIEISGLENINLSKATNLKKISLRLPRDSRDGLQNIPIDLRFLQSLPNCKLTIQDVGPNDTLDFLVLKDQKALISFLQEKYPTSKIYYPFLELKNEELYNEWTVSIDRISRGFPPNDKGLPRLRLPVNASQAQELQKRLWNFMGKTTISKEIPFPISTDVTSSESPGILEKFYKINWRKLFEISSGKSLKNVLSHNEVSDEEFNQLEEEYKKYVKEYKIFIEDQLNKNRGKISQDEIKLLEKDIEILSSLFDLREPGFGPLLDNARRGIKDPNGKTNYDLRKGFRPYVYQLKNYKGCWEHPVYKFLTQNFVKDCGQAGYKDFEIPFTTLLDHTLDDDLHNQGFYKTIYEKNRTGLSREEIENGKRSESSEYGGISEILFKKFLREKESWISQFLDSGLERWLREGQLINTWKALRGFLGLPEQSVAVHGGALMVSSKRVFEKALEEWTIPNLIQWTQETFDDLKISSKDLESQDSLIKAQAQKRYKIMSQIADVLEKLRRESGSLNSKFYKQDMPDFGEEGDVTLEISREATALLLEALGYVSCEKETFIPINKEIKEPIHLVQEFIPQPEEANDIFDLMGEHANVTTENQKINDIFHKMRAFLEEITEGKPEGDPTINAKRGSKPLSIDDGIGEEYKKKVKLDEGHAGK